MKQINNTQRWHKGKVPWILKIHRVSKTSFTSSLITGPSLSTALDI